MQKYYLLFSLFFLQCFHILSQTIPAGAPVLEEALRRKQLLGELDSSISFNLRPLRSNFITDRPIYEDYSFFVEGNDLGPVHRKSPKKTITILPIQNTIQFNS